MVVVLWMRIFNQNLMKIPDTRQERRRFIKEHLYECIEYAITEYTVIK